MRGPENECRRLAELYASMIDGELRNVAEDPKSITEIAFEALKSEFGRRGLAENVNVDSDAFPEKQFIPELLGPVIVRRFTRLEEALVARAAVESAGIECLFYDDNIVRANCYLSNLVGGLKLVVRSEDVLAAIELLDVEIPEVFEVTGVGEYRQPKCSQCGSLDVISEVVKEVADGQFVPSYLTSASQEGWKCQSCGHALPDSSEKSGND
jgi:hypothetical protein